MTGNFIKLTDFDGGVVYINTSMVSAIMLHHSNGSKIKLAMNEDFIKVKESPDEVVKMVKNNNKMYL